MRKGITKINAQNLLWVHTKSGRGVNNTDEVDHNRLMGISKMGQKYIRALEIYMRIISM